MGRLVSLLVAGVAAAAFCGLPACNKEEEKKPVEVKKAETKETPKAEVKKEEPKEIKKEEPRKEEPKVPTAGETLDKVVASFPAYTYEPGKVEAYLQGLKEVQAKFPGLPEAKKALLLEARTKVDFLVAATTKEQAGLTVRLMAVDGKAAAGTAPTDEEVAQYLKGLAAQYQQAGETADKTPDPAPNEALRGYAALLFFLAQERLEAAGKIEGTKIVLTPEAAAGTGPYVLAGGADAAVLHALARTEGQAGLRARYLIVLRMQAGLAAATSFDFLTGWTQVADGMGKALCAACGKLGTVPREKLHEVLFLKDNAGLVCDKAKADIEAGIPAVDAVRKFCLASFDVGEGDAAYVTPFNALFLRMFALVKEVGMPAPDVADPLAPEFARVHADVRAKMIEMVALFPAVETFPKEKWEEMKARLVLRNDLIVQSPQFDYLPFETFVADEAGISKAWRPVARRGETPVQFEDRGRDLTWPGRLVLDLAGIQKELEEKNKGLKEQKATWDEQLGAFVMDVTIRGTTFKKPDYSIPSVIKAAEDISGKAADLEPKAFPYLAGKGVLNSERPAWPSYPETVGKAVLVAIDRETPALLFRRFLDSFYYAGMKDDRLVKGTGLFDTVPTVYFTEKFVDETVLDTTYKRPILVYVTAGGYVRFYPPTNKTWKGKMTAKRNPRRRDVAWPGKFASEIDPREVDPIWNLFYAYTKDTSPKFETDVMGIARAMKDKWDNGNVFYIVADDTASSGLIVKVADMLSRLEGDKPLADLALAFPGYTCDPEKGPQYCINDIVVLFPDVEIPVLPGKKKVDEVEQNVYCDKDDIAQKIGAKKGAIKFCYDGELQKNPALKGKVVYKFTIGPEGRVKAISVVSDGLGNDKVVTCTQNIIKSISFRRPIGGECTIQYPYNFTP